MERIDVDKQKLYILGVSGGPDSMALFDMCRKQGIKVIAAHMNYGIRDSAKRDMDIVETYCLAHGITFEKRMQNKECTHNFQAFARDMRYAFYLELVEAYHADGVLLAHQMDDHLETYLMQKEKKKKAHFYGIQVETEVLGCHILRPLLHYTKEQLETYCKENNVSYGIDESNLSDHYMRNRIRHATIEKMSYEEKLTLCKEIEQVNNQWVEVKSEAHTFLKHWHEDMEEASKLEWAFLQETIAICIYEECQAHISKALLDEICHLIKNKAKRWTKRLMKSYYMYEEYGKICIDKEEDVSYQFTYAQLQYEKQEFFEITSVGSGVEALTLKKEDFPITVRSFQMGDEITLRFGKKKVNRWFIDRKIPKKERKTWPIVVNAQENVILVPKIGCDIAHFSNNPTCFVLK